MSVIQIAVIDDHDLFREGIKLVLNQIDGFEVVFDASNGTGSSKCLIKSSPILS
jgi:two-component system, NarL family, response regulator DegU